MDSKNAVLKYLRDQNRPYSLNDIFTNMHKEHGKTAVLKSLDTLVQEGLIIEKTYGKQKVYAFNQRNECEKPPQERNVNIDAEIHSITDELAKTEKQLKEVENLLNGYSSSLTTEDAKLELTTILREVGELKEEVSILQSGKEIIPPSVCETIIASHGKMIAEWRKRKYQCMQMVAAVTENMTQNKIDFMSDLGMETDEDLKVSISAMASVQ